MVRFFVSGLVTTSAICAGSTGSVNWMAFLASPWSEIRRLVWLAWETVLVKLKPSTYWWRTASVFGSHWSFLTSFMDLPGLYSAILYGPRAAGALSYFAFVSCLAGTME